MSKLTIFVCSLLATCCVCSELPSTFKKCDRNQSNFNQCLKEAVEHAIRQLNKAKTNIGLYSLDPLEIPSLSTKSGRSFVLFPQNYKNLNLYGFTNIHVLNLDMNFHNKTLFMDCLLPQITWEFDYDFDGTLLSLPFKGRGPGTVIMRNVRFILAFALDEYKKKGEKYFKVFSFGSLMEAAFIRVNFENLFDGDKVLGYKMNKLINEHSVLLFNDIRPDYEEVFGQIFSGWFNYFLAKVPINELFGPELHGFVPDSAIPSRPNKIDIKLENLFNRFKFKLW